MSKYFDALIWIDRREAKIFQISADEASKIVLNPDAHAPASHREGPAHHGTPRAGDAGFFRRIAGELGSTGGTLITGPGNTKFELKEYLDLHDQKAAARICGVETIEATDDEELIARGRRFFETRGHRDTSAELNNRRPNRP